MGVTIEKEEEESRSKDTWEVCAGNMGTWLYIHPSISKQHGSKDVKRSKGRLVPLLQFVKYRL